jgi:hypothetical protein
MGAANAAVATENGQTEVNGCAGHDATRHRRAGNVPHSVNDLNREGGLLENVGVRGRTGRFQ